MEPMVSFDLGVCLHSEKELHKDADCGVISSVEDHVASTPPAKKQTRQWAAWTRQEEESFFTALRQVGKNFEKITCRVQSKNKDQVRHYYYRLVRRMNKLLGPELCLDAKNSKDTNAAMLRWWSLLERYSCKASKLHLKPRRFKIFIETLEHQLMKDRKRKIRKRHSQGGNCSTTPPVPVSNQGTVKPVLLDSQKIQKLGSGKGSAARRTNTGANRNSSKGESSSVKAARQRRRSGTASTAAYKKWEKAAIAGVSLVADAAAHLEQTSMDKLVDHVQDSQGEKASDLVAKDVPSLPTFQQTLFAENTIQISMKLKLQLFPIDEGTRRALEMDNHNPHLELTLSMRKKISSVLEHLHRKWGSSSIASGTLMLLPYCAQRENFASCQKWTQDSVLSASDVYALTGSPNVFRLRYGWFQVPSASCVVLGEQNTNINEMQKHIVDPVAVPTLPAGRNSENPLDSYKDQIVSAEKISTMVASLDDFPNKVTECNSIKTNKNVMGSSDLASSFSWQRRDVSNGAIRRQLGHMDDKGSHKGTTLSAVEWADSLTNISVGDLLSEVSHNADANCNDQHPQNGSQPLQQIPFSCDSFDAAIAAHIYKHQSRTTFQPTLSSSIWDAEETCDAFSFQKNSVFREKVKPTEQIASTSSVALGTNMEDLPVAEELLEPMDDDPAHGDPMDVCQPDRHSEDNSAKDLSGLNDIYWPDSLGPLDLDIPSCRYNSDELIFSDSLGGLNRLVSSSLDAFQNCSFFGLDKKETASTVEARGTATFSDYKIGSEV